MNSVKAEIQLKPGTCLALLKKETSDFGGWMNSVKVEIQHKPGTAFVTVRTRRAADSNALTFGQTGHRVCLIVATWGLTTVLSTIVCPANNGAEVQETAAKALICSENHLSRCSQLQFTLVSSTFIASKKYFFIHLRICKTSPLLCQVQMKSNCEFPVFEFGFRNAERPSNLRFLSPRCSW
ncbi:unnamed protein product [Caenorhabditis auriculariae]|uniref:Uncharacterized protein n=1 Tax=Caenorhabditis auriculariae TaxID=2777116 RepID=A0A8S1H5H9_9PELO|nr:unnamed protein product [Caenorhabditis auriculariae]